MTYTRVFRDRKVGRQREFLKDAADAELPRSDHRVVGLRGTQNFDRAGIWNGSAGSWFDLGPGQARAIVADGSTLYVAGESGGRATVWTLTAVPEPAEWAAVAGLGLLGFGLWRRRAA